MFIEDGAAGPLEIANTGIGIHTENKNVALAPGAFEITNMSDVQRIKAAVGQDDAPALALMFRESLAQHIPRDDFGSGLTHDLRGGSRCLATDGVEKLFARNGSGAAFHDHQTAGDVGDVSGFEWRCSAGKRQRVRGENGVAGAGDVNGLIAAVNGDLREAMTRFEKSCTVPSAGDQEGLQFHLRKSGSACTRELAGILTDGRVMLRLKLGLIWRSGGNARFRIAVQPVTRVERDGQLTFALRGCLLHKLRRRYAKAVVGNSERVGMAQICKKPLMEFFSNSLWQRRFRVVVDAKNLLSHGVRPASEKAAFGWRGPALYPKDAGNVNARAAEMSDQ